MIYERIAISQEPEAALTVYLHEQSPEIETGRKRPLVLICPGGGYENVSAREAEPVAIKFLSLGYHAAVLRYSVASARFPVGLEQLAKSVILLKQNSERWGIIPEKIILAGFSAGGHLVGSYGLFWDKELLAEIGTSSDLSVGAMILSYPVVSSGVYGHEESFRNLLGTDYSNMKERLSIEKQADQSFPPSFIWHTMKDNVVPVQNSLLLVNKLLELEIPVEFHMFTEGLHGLSLGTVESQRPEQPQLIQPEVQVWPQLADTWLKCLFGGS